MAALSTPPRGPTAAPSYCRSARGPAPLGNRGATFSGWLRGSSWQVSPTGELTVSQSVTSGGVCPRHCVLDYAPAGDAWLRIANLSPPLRRNAAPQRKNEFLEGGRGNRSKKTFSVGASYSTSVSSISPAPPEVLVEDLLGDADTPDIDRDRSDAACGTARPDSVKQ